MFPTYAPWHPRIQEEMLKQATRNGGGLMLLDVQLGSACNGHCPRCDSSCAALSEPAELDIDAVAALAAEIDKRNEARIPNVGFVCGLGEPTFGRNLIILKKLIAATADYHFVWSIFNNGIYWDDELEEYVKDGRLAVMVQYNSDRPETVAEMLGVGPELAARHIANRRHLLMLARELGQRCNSGVTNIAASIVPERGNLGELMGIVDQCVSNGVFPLIGELENAGDSENEYYAEHKLSNEELADLHAQIGRRFGINYEVPFCPAAIGAIHVNNRNIVTVDKFTGLSCSWFGMSNPEPYEIGDIRKMSYDGIVRIIMAYRDARIPEVRKAIREYPEMVFGGCGGNARMLLEKYVSLYGGGK